MSKPMLTPLGQKRVDATITLAEFSEAQAWSCFMATGKPKALLAIIRLQERQAALRRFLREFS
jgi:hypothetical protein